MAEMGLKAIDVGNGISTVLIIVLGLTVYTTYGAIWRLYLSPISHIPGPRFAALTFWNEFYYDVILGGRYTWKLKEYHEKYGPIIRINPYEIHINDPDMYDEVYVGSSKAKTNKWFWSPRCECLGSVISIFDTLDHDKHRMRREPWNPYFSKQSVSRLQPTLIQATVDKFCARLADYKAAGMPVVMTYAFATVATDIISEYSFPRGYNLLDQPEFDTENYDAWVGMSRMGHVLKQFGWLYPLLDSIPLWVTKMTSPETYLVLRHQDDLLQQTLAIAKQRERPPDYADTKARPSLMQAIMESGNLPESEKSPYRIKGEAQAAIAAGTMTSTHALKTATYHILANETIHTTLMRELEEHIPNPQTPPTMRQLENMPYLVAIMYETLRVFYGTSHRLQRIFPSRTLQYKQYSIPPGTPISMTVLHIHDNADIFPDPYTFKPERWLAPKEGEKQPPFKYLVAFSKGSRSCVGIDLAKAEILTILANMFRRYGHELTLFETERERDIDVKFDVFNPLPSRESNGLMVMFKKGND